MKTPITDHCLIEILPTAPTGWREHDYVPVSRSKMGLARQSDGAAPREGMLRLSRYSSDGEEPAIQVPAVTGSCVETLPDGGWLVVASRASRGEANGRIYGQDGALLRSFPVGDAVQQVACTAKSILWVGYFDQHTRRSALAAYDTAGAYRFDVITGGYLLDCYALTVSGEEAWACTYPDFPIVRTGLDGVEEWTNEIRGASAIAVFRQYVLLAGGYGSDRDRLAILQLVAGRAEVIAEDRLPILLRPDAIARGLGDTLHIVSENRWHRLEISRIVGRL